MLRSLVGSEMCIRDRFLLGAAEAGFFPGVVYYLSYWYPEGQRARAIAAFMTAVPVSGVIGGPLSGALLNLNGLLGLAGCLLYTSDAADERSSVDLGGRRII